MKLLLALCLAVTLSHADDTKLANGDNVKVKRPDGGCHYKNHIECRALCSDATAKCVFYTEVDGKSVCQCDKVKSMITDGFKHYEIHIPDDA